MKERPILFQPDMVQAILEERKTQTRRTLKPQPPSWVGSERERVGVWMHMYGMHPAGECGNNNCACGSGNKEYKAMWTAKCPYGDVGDILWVREAWKFTGINEDGEVCIVFKDGTRKYIDPSSLEREEYWNDKLEKLLDDMSKKDKVIVDEENERFTWQEEDVSWKPSIHMPREVCRTRLKIKNIHVELAQDISEKDAVAEGVLFYDSKISGTRQYKDYMADASGYGHPDHDYPSVLRAKTSFQTLWVSINGAESWAKNPYVWVVEFEILK